MGAVETRVRLLGVAEVQVGDTVVSFHNRRAMALLAYLVLEGGPHARSTLAAMLWEDSEPRTAAGNLRVLLSDLRARVPDLIRIERARVEWVGGASVHVDVDELRSALHRAESSRVSSHEARTRLAAVTRHVGELLPGYEDLGMSRFAVWLEAERDLLRHQVTAALGDLIETMLDGGGVEEAVQAARRLVARDEYQERSHVLLANALVAAGRPVDAKRQLDRCRVLIEGELGFAPSPEFDALAVSIAAVPQRRVADRIAPLPPVRPLIARHELCEKVVAAGDAGGLVTLVGPAGVGKTSLALTVAHAWRGAGADVVFVDLTLVDRPDLVGGEIVTALTGSGDTSSDAYGHLARVVGDRDVRIVLDNLEHVADAASDIGRFVASCPRLTVLATSRRALNVRAERVVVVPGLEVPGEHEAVEAAARRPAVRLFLDRARDAGAVDVDGADEIRAAAAICQMLGGLPLAIELVAARRRFASARSIQMLIERDLADGRLSVAAGGSADTPERHRSLNAALMSSVELLSTDERTLFTAAAVFEGPFSVDDLHKVGAPEKLADDLLPAVGALVDLGLLHRADAVVDNGHDADDGPWLSMLPYVQAVASRLLDEATRHDEVVRRRVEHDIDLVQRAAASSAHPDSRRWLARIDRYWPSLRATLDRLLDESAPAAAAMVVVALGPYWMERGRFAQGARLAARCGAVGSGGADSPPWLAGELRLWSRMLSAEAVGYASTDAADGVMSAIDEIREAGAPAQVELQALVWATHVMDQSARGDLAQRLVADGLDLAERVGAPWYAMELRYAAAVLARVEDDDEAAAGALLRRVLADAELHDHQRIWIRARMMAELIGVDGPPGGRTPSLAELLDLAIEVGDRRQIVWLVVSLGTVAALRGDLAEGAGLFLDAVTLSRDSEYFLGTVFALMGGAGIASFGGDVAQALEFHGAVEADLDSAMRSMPRSYVEAYLGLAAVLDDAEPTTPDGAERRAQGRSQPRSVTLDRLTTYLAGAT